MKTRLLTTLIAAFLALSAWARDAVEIDGIYYYLYSSDNTASVTSGDSKYQGDIIIPASVTYDGTTYSVSSINRMAFYNCTGLTSVTIPSSVTTIGGMAFWGCTGLTSVTIPNSVTSIGNSAFRGCDGLTSVTIPNSVTSIGSLAFMGCSAITTVTIDNNAFIGYLSNLFGSLVKTYIIGENVTSIASSVFDGCSALTSVTIDKDNKTYDSRDNCNAIIETASNTLIAGINNSTIPSSVTSIGSSAFSGCSGLTSITIPNSVTSIGSGAFARCTGLTSITIPDAVTTIGNEAFYNCTGLTSVTIGNSVTTIGNEAFYYCRGLTSINIPASVTSIGEDAFSMCDGLTRVDITDIAAWCGISFESLTANPLCHAKAKHLYLNGKEVTDLTIPSSVTSIKDYAFYFCIGLTSITIPSSVTSIGEEAFHYCTGLTSITIPNSVISIGEGAFSYCGGLTSITVEAGNTKYDSRDNCNAIIETASNTLIRGCNATTIPSSVTSIGNSAFSLCRSLTNITIPSSVTSIGNSAFANCSGLTNITIPSSVTSIGEDAFFNCDGLTNITIPESVTTIGNEAFSNCGGLTTVTINSNDVAAKAYKYNSNLIHIFGEQVTTYIFGDAVTSIGDYAFYFSNSSNLTEVYTGNSVTTIGKYAFRGCDGLTSITIPASVTSIGEDAFQYCTSLKYINALRTVPEAYNCDKSAFDNVPTSTCTLYVPSGSKEAYKSLEPWSNFTNIKEEPIQVGGLLYTIQGNEATCVGPGSVEGWFNNPVENIPERITFDGKEYIVTAVEGVSYDGSIIVLPKTLKRIGSLSAQNNVIICLSPTPPEIESTSVSRCALYVPDEYLEAHRKGWVIDGKLFGNRYNSSLDVEAYPNLISYYIRPMSHLLNYVYDDETMTATINGFRLVTYNGTFTISEALGCTSSRMSSTYRERIWAEQNDINLDWVVPATITKFQYIYAGRTQTRVKTGETYAVKKVAKLLGARSVTLSEGIEEVGQRAFSLDLWPVVTDAEGNAQYYNDPLESVSLPSTLKLLDRSAFHGCTSLKHVEMKEGLDSIGMSSFTYCLSLEDCHLPASLRAMGIGHGNLYSLQAFSTAQGSENIVAKDGVLFSDGGKTLLQYPAGKPDTTYEVPEGTVKLSEWSFEAVQELESIILPASVEEIGTWIFANTHCLKHIYCKSQTPPNKIGGWWLKASAPIRPDDAVLSSYDINNEITVHVPTGCKEIYANTIGWKGFNIVEEEDLTAIQPLTLSPSEAGESYYNLQGQRIAEPQRGQLVIVRRADGSSRKMYVR